MRVVVIPLAAVFVIGAGEPPQSSLDNPAYTTPPERWASVEEAIEALPQSSGEDPANVVIEQESPDWSAELREKLEDLAAPWSGENILGPEVCSDRIHEARVASGQPPLLDREPAADENPQAIYAVDRRQEGCSVMVVMGNRQDIRPLPKPSEGPIFHRIPAQAGQ